MMHILVVNINGLEYTKSLVNDLRNQTCEFKLTLVDQGSTEEGTKEYLSFIDDFNVIRNDTNVELNRLWNTFYLETVEPYLCFLNNDTRVTYNFVKDTVEIFEREPSVGCIVHITNDGRCPTDDLSYVVSKSKFVQGWDFTVRREAYSLVPDELKWFGGDDWIFSKLYADGWKAAVALSSPVIHYGKGSRQYYTGNRNEEVVAYSKYGYPRLPYGARV